MKQHRIVVGVMVVLAWSGYLHDASAGTQTAFFDTLNGAATVAPIVTAGDTVFLDSLVTGQIGALSQSVTFTLDSAVTGLTGLAAWALSPPAGTGPRLVGVNLDLFNANNALVISNAGATVSGRVASTSFASAIGPGTYTLRATGAGVRDSALDVALSFTGTSAGGGAASAGGLPAQGAVTNTKTAFFDTLSGTRTVAPPLAPGDTLNVDSLVTTETGPLSQTVGFTVGAGADGITGLADWILSTAAGPGPRLVGVSIDIFDANNVLVGSDIDLTEADGVARSNFDFSLTPGSYTLVATGTGARDSSLDIALSVTGTATAAAVPEPSTGALLASGLVAGGLLVRRRNGRPKEGHG